MPEQFELLEEIGAGGMGVVWKARDTETSEVVALKLLHPHLARDPDYIARFEREVEVARRIDSPHVVKVLGYGVREGVPYMTMEYVAGTSLRELLRTRGSMPWTEAKPLIRQVAQGLAAVHAAGVIHRDVKPSNILIEGGGTAKLADFGIARALELTRLTGSSTMLGTPHYMAPEGTASPQSDLYALGCVLFEMLAGRPPFEGETQQAVIAAHIRDLPQTEILPADARPFAAWLLAKSAADRPSSGANLVAALDGVTAVGSRRTRRLLPLVVAAGGSFGMLTIVALVLLFQRPGAPRTQSATPPAGGTQSTASPSTTPERFVFTATVNGVGPGAVHDWDTSKPLTLCYHLSPENIPFVFELARASDGARIGTADDNGQRGGDCLDLSGPVAQELTGPCSAVLRVGALVDDSYQGGRVDFTIKKMNC